MWDAAPVRRRPIGGAILLIFLLSGAAGLIYEVVWARELILIFGNTTQAVSAVLTAFFGGMAIGSVIGGRAADRVRSPLRLYAIVELAIAVAALLTPLLFGVVQGLYRLDFANLERVPSLLALVRVGLTLLALGPATVLMGATLPILSRHLARRRGELGIAFGRLYAFNTLGAIIGTALAGLVTIELLGLRATLLCGAACSATAGVGAWLLARAQQRGEASSPARATVRPEHDGAAEAEAGSTASGAPARPGDVRPRPHLALVVAFMSGLSALGYQVLWTRLIASGSGNTTYAFTAILIGFLVGISLGAELASLIAPRVRHPVALVGMLQVLIAVSVLWGLAVATGAFWALGFGQRLVLALLPMTLALGLTLPLAAGLVADRDAQIGTRTGLLLGANTAGTVVGTFVVPFVLVPIVGTPRSVVVLAALNLLLALSLLARSDAPARRRVLAGSLACLLLVVTLLGGAIPNRVVVDPAVNAVENVDGTVWATGEDEIASVVAGEFGGGPRLIVAGTGMTTLTVDAKLMAVLPAALRPHAASALVIAFGMGSTYRESLRLGWLVDGVELVPTVPAMFRYYYPDAAAVLADPRGHLIIGDGRNHVELTDRSYDVIMVDPPPPVRSSGTSVLYTREFYEASHARLNPGGVMMEWMPYDNQTMDEFRSQVRTFLDVFPNVLVVRGAADQGVLMLGSDERLTLDASNVRAILGRPGVTDDLDTSVDAPVRTIDAWAELIPRLVWLSNGAVSTFAGNASAITDDQPRTEYFLLRGLFGTDRSPTMTATTVDQIAASSSGQ